MNAQFNDKVNTITTTSTSPPVFRYNQMGQITTFDYGNTNSSLVISNDIDNGISSIRVESITDAKTINYNRRILHPNGFDIFATDIDFSSGNGTSDYILCGFTHDVGGTQGDKMFLYRPNPTFLASTAYLYTELSLGLDDYEHTYALDVLVRTKDRNDPVNEDDEHFYVVGFVSDVEASRLSSKRPFIACFKYDLTLSWYRILPNTPSPDFSQDLFNTITEVEYQGGNYLLATGTCSQDMYSSGSYDKSILNVLFTYNGLEVNNNFHLTNSTGTSPNYDNSVVGDVYFDGHDAYILSNEKIRKGVTVERFDLSTFNVTAGFNALLSNNNQQVESFGFKLFNYSPTNLGVIGYLPEQVGLGTKFNSFAYQFDKASLTSSTPHLLYHMESELMSFNTFNPYFGLYTFGGSNVNTEALAPNISYFDPNFPVGGSGMRGIFITGNYAYSIAGVFDSYQNTLISNAQIFYDNNYLCTADDIDAIDDPTIPLNLQLTGPISNLGNLVNVVNTHSIDNAGSTRILCDGAAQKTSNILDAENAKVKVYPSPASEYVYISSGMVDYLTTLKIFNIQGKSMPVVTSTLPNGEIRVDIHSFETGLYYISYSNAENPSIVTTKFIVE